MYKIIAAQTSTQNEATIHTLTVIGKLTTRVEMKNKFVNYFTKISLLSKEEE